jgi:brefeldin A-resistance guanine nucleotide exchange factor 1
MYTSGAFTTIPPHDLAVDSVPEYNHLWDITWERLDGFMPNLKRDLFPAPAPAPAPEHKADAVNHAPDLSPAPESQKDSPEPEDKSSEIIDASSIVQAI